MLKHLLGRSIQSLNLAEGTTGESRRAGIREAYANWRAERDVDAIMAAFGRLTDRQLAMLGVHRDEIHFVVAELLATASERWKIGAEVAWIFEDGAELAASATAAREKSDEGTERAVT